MRLTPNKIVTEGKKCATEAKNALTDLKMRKTRGIMLDFVNKYIIGTSVPILLMTAGVFYLIILKGTPLKNPLKMIKAMITPNENEKDGISPFRSVTMALAGTLGVGNIVGVASAIALGGFGAIFWMWISALVAMILKYAEITLAVSHRRKRKKDLFEEENHGGAMFYIKDYFELHGKKKLGVILASVFAAFCVVDSISMGCIVQVNAVSSAFKGVSSVPTWVCGILLTVMTALVITKGTSGISALTEYLVPLMSLGYIIMSVAVMIIGRDRLPEAMGAIFRDAFSVSSTAGGVLGFLVSDALRFGTMRGLLSNEAGCGTAPFAHAASNTSEPAKQGVWGIFEVFVDTIILCTMTALVIILNFDDAVSYASDGIMMTVKAYSAVLGKGAEYFLAIAVLLFAYATVICWAQYGRESVSFLFPNKKRPIKIFTAIYCVSVFVGSVIAPSAIWTLADFCLGSITLMNLLTICLMAPEVRTLTGRYFR